MLLTHRHTEDFSLLFESFPDVACLGILPIPLKCLLQVFSALKLNEEYWLGQDLRAINKAMPPLHLLLLDLCTALIRISNGTAVFTALGLEEAFSYVLNHSTCLPVGSQYYRKSLKHLELPKEFRERESLPTWTCTNQRVKAQFKKTVILLKYVGQPVIWSPIKLDSGNISRV